MEPRPVPVWVYQCFLQTPDRLSGDFSKVTNILRATVAFSSPVHLSAHFARIGKSWTGSLVISLDRPDRLCEDPG